MIQGADSMAKQKTVVKDLTEGSLARNLITFSLPFLAANLLQMVYNMVDMIIVGQAIGSAGLTAVSIGGQVTGFLTIVGSNFASGGQVFVAQTVGSGSRDKLGRAIGSLVSILCLISLVLMAVGFGLCGSLLTLLNTPIEAYDQAVDYLMVCCCGLLFVYGYNAVCASLRGMGDTKDPLIFVGISALLNVFLDLFFVRTLGMGAKGAAIATVISQGVAFVSSLVCLYIKREAMGFDMKPGIFVPDRHNAAIIMKLGVPMALQQVAIQVSMLYISTFINGYGLTASTVYGIGNKLYSVIASFTSTIVAATAVMVGQCMGAGAPEKADRTVKIAYRSVIVVAIPICLAAWLLPEAIFSIFDSDPAVLAMAPDYMHIAVLLYIAFALMAPGNGLVAGVGNSVLNMVIAILDGVVARIALSFLFAFGLNMGLYGFFLGNSLAAFVSVIMGGAYWLSGKWKTRKSLA